MQAELVYRNTILQCYKVTVKKSDFFRNIIGYFDVNNVNNKMMYLILHLLHCYSRLQYKLFKLNCKINKKVYKNKPEHSIV